MTSSPERAPTSPVTTADERDHPETAISAARLAALTGFDDPTIQQQGSTSASTSDRHPGTGEMSDEEIESELSRHTFASHPVSKIIVVFGGVLVIVTLGGFFIHSLTGSKASRKQAPPSEGFSTQVDQATTSDREKAKLLTELAVKDQEEQLKSIDREKPKPTPKPTPKPPPKVNPLPARSYQPVPTVRPLPQSPPVRIVRQFVRVPQQKTKQISPLPPVQQDPYEQWLQASKLGSYGSVTITQQESNKVPATTTTATQYTSRAENPATPTVYSAKDILVGTQVEAVLETPIVFTDRLAQESPRFIVRLTQPLIAADGTSILPVGTQILTRLIPGHAPLVTLAAEAFLLQQDRNWVEYALPKDALLVGGSDFKPLIAKQKKVGRDRRDGTDEVGTALDALDIAGDALDVPVNDLPSRIYRRTARRRYSQPLESVNQVYYLPANIKVRVIVNQSFSPFNSDRPLPIDQGAYTTNTSLKAAPLSGFSTPVVAPSPEAFVQPLLPSGRSN